MTDKQNTAQMPELKPCPFCGAKANLAKTKALSFVQCENCEAEGSPFSSDHGELAIKSWNFRTESQNPKLDIHILLGHLAGAARGEPIDPESCEIIENIAKAWGAEDFTADDLQALYDCGPDLATPASDAVKPPHDFKTVGDWYGERVEHDNGDIVYELHNAPRDSMIVFHGPNAKADREMVLKALGIIPPILGSGDAITESELLEAADEYEVWVNKHPFGRHSHILRAATMFALRFIRANASAPQPIPAVDTAPQFGENTPLARLTQRIQAVTDVKGEPATELTLPIAFLREVYAQGVGMDVALRNPAVDDMRLPDRGVHLSHCNQGEYVGTCKYGEMDCPAFNQSPSMEKDKS